jgi:hypothetical protein
MDMQSSAGESSDLAGALHAGVQHKARLIASPPFGRKRERAPSQAWLPWALSCFCARQTREFKSPRKENSPLVALIKQWLADPGRARQRERHCLSDSTQPITAFSDAFYEKSG